MALVRWLATKGRIAWASSWQGDMVSNLEAQLHLEEEPLRVTITIRLGDEGQPTRKLSSVLRWLANRTSPVYRLTPQPGLACPGRGQLIQAGASCSNALLPTRKRIWCRTTLKWDTSP